MTQITAQIVDQSVIYDPGFAPTIPAGMTIAEYRRARQRPEGGRMRRGLSFALRGALNAAAAGLSSS